MSQAPFGSRTVRCQPSRLPVGRRRIVPLATAAASLLAVASCSSTPSVSGSTRSAGPSTSATGPPPTTAVDPDTPQVATPVAVRVPVAPIPFAGSDGETHAVYELFLTNAAPTAATVDRIRVLDELTDATVVEVDAATLDARLELATGQDPDRVLQPAQSATVYLHLTFPDAAAVPTSLTHDVDVSFAESGTLTETSVGTVAVDLRTVPDLGPPLKGEGYLAADGCCDSARHREAILPVNGTRSIAQRYAIDWEQVDEQGRIYDGDKLDPKSYAIYGDEALAMADGTVVRVVDGLPEQVPGTFPENPTLEEADGNSVVIDLGNKSFLNYAHLQPGSLRVKEGDTVKAGQVLGLVGNSGNSLAPHLHIHLMDSALPVASSGYPYTIDAFTVTGAAVSTAAFDRAEADGTPLEMTTVNPPTRHEDQYPMDQSLVTFG